MKKIFTVIICTLCMLRSPAQNIGIGTTTPNASALLDINSTNKGLLIPRTTTSQRLSIANPANGLLVYDTDKNELYHYNGTNWRVILNGEYWSRGITARDRIGNSTDSVGIGVLSPTTRLDVRGNVRIVDGNQAAGRVLTSDASGIASWQSAAYGNNDRIMIRYTDFGTDSLINGVSTIYDNGGINFSTITTNFTVTASGLYHFEGTMSSFTSALANAEPIAIKLEPYLSINNGALIPLSSFVEFTYNNFYIYGYSPMKFVHPFNIDLYLNAGSTVKFKFSSTFSILSGNNSPGYISAYLINE